MSLVTLDSKVLQVTVNPQVGGTITSVFHKPTGLSVLGRVPWGAVDAPLDSLAARNEPEWLTRYTGGWPLLFPNAGDACEVGGVFHGFHGEASIAPWEVVESGEQRIVLERQFSSLPASMRRVVSVAGETLSVWEEISHSGVEPVDVMWGHHPTFGSDLLASPFEVTCGARDVQAEPMHDPPANPLMAGAMGHWPVVPAKYGTADLSHPSRPWASVAYLTHFRKPWAAIRRQDNAIAVMLCWDKHVFPCAWLWYELEATAEAPWAGHTRLVGIEPNTTPCALGLAESKRRLAPLLHLLPGASIATTLHLHVFKPSEPILNGPEELGIGNQT